MIRLAASVLLVLCCACDGTPGSDGEPEINLVREAGLEIVRGQLHARRTTGLSYDPVLSAQKRRARLKVEDVQARILRLATSTDEAARSVVRDELEAACAELVGLYSVEGYRLGCKMTAAQEAEVESFLELTDEVASFSEMRKANQSRFK